MMSSFVGEGLLGMPIGYAMALFGPRALYWAEMVLAILAFSLLSRAIDEFQTENKKQYLLGKEEIFETS